MAVAPEWLTQAYIEDALKIYHKDASATITGMHTKPAVGKGENFGGILTRLKLHYTLKNGSEKCEKALLAKTSFEEDEFSRKKMEPYDVFNREISIYEKVMPKLNSLLAEINDNDKLFAEAVHVDYDHQLLIFEDLGESGFVMADRLKRLDKEHILLVLRKLAKMHATSAVLNEREHGVLESYDRGFFNRHSDSYASFFVGSLVECGKYLSKLPYYAHYGKKILALKPNYMEIGKRCFSPTPGHVNVLAHGDCWTNNVMFKYCKKTGSPLDVMLIDFQYSFWGSPAIDMHYLFNTSLKEQLRLEAQDSLFQYYHSIFSDVLHKLHYRQQPVPTLRTFRLQVEEKGFMAMHSTLVVQPIMLNEANEDADFSAIMSEDERGLRFKASLYDNVVVQKQIQNLLPTFDSRGLLEVNQAD